MNRYIFDENNPTDSEKRIIETTKFHADLATSEEEKERCLKRIEKITREILERHKIANTIELPKKYDDIWVIWYFGDNDFGSAIEEGAFDFFKQYSEKYKSHLWRIAWLEQIVNANKGNKEYSHITEELEKDKRIFNPYEELATENTLKKLCILSGIKMALYRIDDTDFSSNKVKERIDNFVNYFGEFKKDNFFVGTSDEADLFLDAIKFENEHNVCNTTNFKDFWWDGEVLFVHILNGKLELCKVY